MFAVFYRTTLKPGKEAEYKKLWHTIAQYFIQHRGALGSCLHKASDGTWVAYSRWPDKQTRDASWAGQGSPDNLDLNEEIQEVIRKLKECMSGEYEETCMEVIEDLL